MRRVIQIFIVLAVIGVFLLSVAGVTFLILSGGDPVGFARTTALRVMLSTRQEDLETPLSADTTPRLFEIQTGDTPAAVASRLQAQNFIADADLFVNYMRVEGLDTQLKSNKFFINSARTIPELAAILTDASNATISFTTIEGARIEEVAEFVDAVPRFNFTGAEFLQIVDEGAVIPPEFAIEMGIPSGSSLEGFMFPGTYELRPDVTAIELRDALLNGFSNALSPQMHADAQQQGYTIREIVIIASIAEREAVHNDEHPLITSVYRNRLDIGMKLDADPTVQYGLQGARGRWWPGITPADYQGVISDYNTYLPANGELPPGPIASPSLSAIRAAIYPVESSYIYFRAKCDGSNYHAFATTYDEHLANGC